MSDITVNAFLAEYRKGIEAMGYRWLSIPGKLDKFMSVVEGAITDAAAPPMWSPVNNPVAVETWRKLGGKGRLTLATLRNLPPF